jgi:hypothetical protein
MRCESCGLRSELLDGIKNSMLAQIDEIEAEAKVAMVRTCVGAAGPVACSIKFCITLSIKCASPCPRLASGRLAESARPFACSGASKRSNYAGATALEKWALPLALRGR